MKTWLITGCSSGIGRGIAEAALKRGDCVVVTARNKDHIMDFEPEYSDRVLKVSLELTNDEMIDQAVRLATEHFGKIDILINNAGHGYRSALEEGEAEGINEVFQTNFFGAVKLIQRVLPQMRERKDGAIVNISSIAAISAGVGSGYYAATKAALELVSDALWQEVSPLGIKVMIVEPGVFRTRFYDDSLKGTAIKIGDYSETAGKTRAENVKNDHKQPGDPIRGGKVIVDTILKDNYPRRLLLGTDAVDFARKQYQTRLDEIAVWDNVSGMSDYKDV